MIGLTEAQQEILGSLRQAVFNGNFQEVQNVLDNNEHNDIQQVLKFKFLNKVLVIRTEEDIKIIALFWEVADQETRDFLCTEKVGNERALILAFEKRQKKMNTNQSLEQVIQKVKEHEKVMDLDSDLQEAIISLDVDEVKAALENCGTDAARVLMRDVYWKGEDADAFLIFPLKVYYGKDLNKEEFEKVKKITKLLWNKASPDVRNFWLEDHMVNEKDQNTGGNYIIDSLEEQQEMYGSIAGNGWLKDFIQEVKDYKTNRGIKLNEPVLKEIEEKERIVQNDRKIAEELQNEEKKDNVDPTASLVSDSNTSPVSTTGNKTLEKNDTNFWSEHKGKIALGVTGLCVAGAVAAYMLAYPVVALALTVLAAVILMGAGIAKVLEDPSVEKTFTQQQEV